MPKLNYLQFGYLTGKDGLLAGENLYLDVKRMEMAYHDLNQHEYELINHISLLQGRPTGLDPITDDRPVYRTAAREALRHGRAGQLLPADQVGRRKHTL